MSSHSERRKVPTTTSESLRWASRRLVGDRSSILEMLSGSVMLKVINAAL